MKVSNKFKNNLLARAIFLLIIVGCSKSDNPATGSYPATFSNFYAKIFSVTCTNCHRPGGKADIADLDFSSASNLYNELFNLVKRPAAPTTCTSVRRVIKGDPNNSYLLAVLFSDYYKNDFGGSAGCTPPSDHLGFSSLGDTEKNALVSWINNGAENN